MFFYNLQSSLPLSFLRRLFTAARSLYYAWRISRIYSTLSLASRYIYFTVKCGPMCRFLNSLANTEQLALTRSLVMSCTSLNPFTIKQYSISVYCDTGSYNTVLMKRISSVINKCFSISTINISSPMVLNLRDPDVMLM